MNWKLKVSSISHHRFLCSSVDALYYDHLIRSSDWYDMETAIKPEVAPWGNYQTEDIFSSSYQKMWSITGSEAVFITLVTNSAGAVSTSILKSPNVCDNQDSNAKSFIKEEETVSARYYMASCDQWY
jgi:hypothetical protein